jgi:lipid A 3-O-deacylase
MRFCRLFAVAAAIVLSGLIGRPGWALDLELFPAPTRSPWLEVRLGGFNHDPFKKEAGSVDFNAEIIFGRLPVFPESSWWSYLIPRPHIGVMANFDGLTSYVYAGGTWTFDITRWFFIEPIFGFAAHNGKLDSFLFFREDFGCPVLFHLGANAGVRLTERWSVMASWKHISNATLCSRNNGMDVYGGQIGYRL